MLVLFQPSCLITRTVICNLHVRLIFDPGKKSKYSLAKFAYSVYVCITCGNCYHLPTTFGILAQCSAN